MSESQGYAGAHPDMGKVGITEPLTVYVTVGGDRPGAGPGFDGPAARAQEQRPVPPWSAEARLRAALGRPALAKRITDALPQPLAVELGDVLWLILEKRVSEEIAKVQQEVNAVVTERMAWIERQRSEKREELSRERFARTTRLD